MAASDFVPCCTGMQIYLLPPPGSDKLRTKPCMTRWRTLSRYDSRSTFWIKPSHRPSNRFPMPPSAGLSFYQPWAMHGDTSPPGCSTQLERECLADERSCREPRKHADFLGGPAALAVCTFFTLCETACPCHVSWGYGQFQLSSHARLSYPGERLR